MPLIALVIALTCLGVGADAQEPRVAVTQAVFTNGIVDRQFSGVVEGTAPAGTIFFWTSLEADRASLEALRRDLKLPVWHRWTRVIGTVADQSTEQVVDEIPLSVGSADIFDALEREVRLRQYFAWRTWSRKDSIRPGSWVVSLHYRDGTPVLCSGRPCRYPVRIRSQ